MKLVAWVLLIGLGCGSLLAQTPKNKKTPPKPAAAQDPGPAPTAYTVENLTVEGNHAFRSEQILRAAGLRAGQKAGKAEFEAARDRLVATGAFDNVSYRYAPSADGEG